MYYDRMLKETENLQVNMTRLSNNVCITAFPSPTASYILKMGPEGWPKKKKKYIYIYIHRAILLTFLGVIKRKL
jgi:hypothetical protein